MRESAFFEQSLFKVIPQFARVLRVSQHPSSEPKNKFCSSVNPIS